MKLPEAIYNDEDVDDARTLELRKWRVSPTVWCFASPDRVRIEDQKWLDKEYQPNINDW